MESTFNLNNEMIKMRKDIKRGKLWAISKLVRNVRNLRSKKGSEIQVSKNKRRAERLVEEIDIIKDLKPDDVFKALLNLKSKFSAEELMISDLPLNQRAIIRIGSATFIKTRMCEIKEKISSFHFERTKKPLPKSLDGFELLDNGKQDIEGSKEDAETRLEMGQEAPSTPLLRTSHGNKKLHPSSTKENEFTTPINVNSKMEFENETEVPNKTNKSELDHFNNDVNDSFFDKENSEYQSSDDDVDRNADSDENIYDPGENTEPKVEEKIIGTTPEGYQIVLPLLPTNHQSLHEKTIEKTFNTLAEGAEVVTDFLPNIGENFNSDDENSESNSDIDLEDLAESARKSKENKNGNEDNNEDMFFIDTKGSTDKKFHRIVNKTNKSADSSEDEALKQVKSCFVESLASVSHQRTKGKNRMSQRARQRLHSKKIINDESNNNNNLKRSTNNSKNFIQKSGKIRTNPKANVSSEKTNQAAQPIHPSWEASRKRKEQQASLKQFQGKRVCFDDSD